MPRFTVAAAVVMVTLFSLSFVVLATTIPEQIPTVLWRYNASVASQHTNTISLRSNDAVVFSTYQWSTKFIPMNSAVTCLSSNASKLFEHKGMEYYKAANGGFYDTSNTVIWVASYWPKTLSIYINHSLLANVTNVSINQYSFEGSLSPDGKIFTLAYLSSTSETRARSYWANGTFISDVMLARYTLYDYFQFVMARTSQTRNPSTGETAYYASVLSGISFFTWNPASSSPVVDTSALPDCEFPSVVMTDRYAAVGCRGVYVWQLSFDAENRTAILNYVVPLAGNSSADLTSTAVGVQIRNDTLFVSWSNANTVEAFNIAGSSAPPTNTKFVRGIDPLKIKLVPVPPLLWSTNLTFALPPSKFGLPILAMLDVTPDGQYVAVMRYTTPNTDVVVLAAATGKPILYTTFSPIEYSAVQANFINNHLHLLFSRMSDSISKALLLMTSYSASQLKPSPSKVRTHQVLPSRSSSIAFTPQEIPPPDTMIDAMSPLHLRQPHELEAISTNKTQWTTRFISGGPVYDMTYSSDLSHNKVILSTQAQYSGLAGNSSVIELTSDTGFVLYNYTKPMISSAQLAVSRASTTVASVFFNMPKLSCTVYIGTKLLGEFGCMQSCCGHSAALSPDGATLALVSFDLSNLTISVQFIATASRTPLHKTPASFEAQPNDRLQWFTQGSTGLAYLLVETYTGVWIIDPVAGAVVTVFSAPDCTQLARAGPISLPITNQMPDGRVLLACSSVYLFDLTDITSPQLVAYILPPTGFAASIVAPFGTSGIIVAWSTYVSQQWQFLLSAYSFNTLHQVPRPTNQSVQVLGSHLWTSSLELGASIHWLTISSDSQYVLLNMSPAKGQQYNVAVVPLLGNGSIVEVANIGSTTAVLSPVITRYRRDGRLEAVISDSSSSNIPFTKVVTLYGLLFDARR